MAEPRSFGKYEILEKIGEGGFAVVYKGRDPFIKRVVAIKACAAEDQSLRTRFFREAEIAGHLQHPNIVTTFDFGMEGTVPYLVQEYLSGEDLDRVIRRKPGLAEEQKIEYLVQIARGLEYAHEKGVIHRDIKPGNLRVIENDRIKIMDFGIAKLQSAEVQLTQKGVTMGTAGYLAPEQLRGAEVDGRADIFAFGVLAYELMCGQRPFQAPTFSAIVQEILTKEPKPLEERWKECPPQLASLVERCLRKKRDERPANFGEVILELADLLREEKVQREASESKTSLMTSAEAMAAVAAGAAEAGAERLPAARALASAGDPTPMTAPMAAPMANPMAATPLAPPPALPFREGGGQFEEDVSAALTRLGPMREPAAERMPAAPVPVPAPTAVPVQGRAQEPVREEEPPRLTPDDTQPVELIDDPESDESTPLEPALEPPPTSAPTATAIPAPEMPVEEGTRRLEVPALFRKPGPVAVPSAPSVTATPPPPLPFAIPAPPVPPPSAPAPVPAPAPVEDATMRVSRDTLGLDRLGAAPAPPAPPAPERDAGDMPTRHIALPPLHTLGPPAGAAAGSAAPDGSTMIRPYRDLAAEGDRIGKLVAEGKLQSALEELEDTVSRQRAGAAPPPVVTAPMPLPTPPIPQAIPPPTPVIPAPAAPDSILRMEPLPPIGAPMGAPAPSAAAPAPASAAAVPAAASRPATPRAPLPKMLKLGILAGAVLLLVVAAFVWWLVGRDKTPEPAPPPPAPVVKPVETPVAPTTATVRVTASPWGELQRVSNAEGKEFPLPPVRTTPLLLTLPPGSYTLTLAHPDATAPATCDVVARAGAAVDCRAVLSEAPASDYFKDSGWWR